MIVLLMMPILLLFEGLECAVVMVLTVFDTTAMDDSFVVVLVQADASVGVLRLREE